MKYEALYKRYEELGQPQTELTFVERLAQYRYYNMDRCVGAALNAAQYAVAKLGVVKHRESYEPPSHTDAA